MLDLKRSLSDPKSILAASAVAAALIAGIAWAVATFSASEPAPAPLAAPNPIPPGPAIPPPTPAGTAAAGAPAPPPEPPKTTARITFTTVPSVHATVSWGKARLGVIRPRIPLVITRPRDSGPLDVVVRAAGYLPVATRAHTFGDTKVTVKLTPPDQQQTLLGYRAPIDAGVPDGSGQPFAPATPDSFAAPPFP